MKLDVPYKQLSTIPYDIIDNLVFNISENDWYISDYRNNATNMGNTNSIPIQHTEKCLGGEPGSAIRNIKKEVLYDKYFPLIEPILDHLKQHYSYHTYTAFLARLDSKSEIGMHRDGNGPFLSLCHRIHVPIITNPDVKYVIDDVEYYWEKGNVYEFDNMRVHGVINRSEEYRVHLVINLYSLETVQLFS